MGNEGYVRATGYCLKCNKRREMRDIKVEKTGGRRRISGTCEVCGSKITKLLKREE